MISARLPPAAVHPLLNHNPFAVVGDNEAVQVEVEAILHCGAVDLGDEPAVSGQFRPIESDPLADRDQLMRRLPRMLAAAAADVHPQLAPERHQPTL